MFNFSKIFRIIEDILIYLGKFVENNTALSQSSLIIALFLLTCVLIGKHLTSYTIHYSKVKDTLELRNSYTNVLNKLIKTMNNKFFNYRFAPIVLILGTNYTANIGNDNVRYIGNNIGWAVNDQLAVITLPNDDNIPLDVLLNITDGSGFQGIIFNIPYNSITENYKSQCIKIAQQYEQIVNKTGIIAPLFITIQIDNLSSIDPSITLGTTFEVDDQFLITCIQELLNTRGLMNIEIISQLKNFQSFSTYCSEILNQRIKIGGIFISSVDNNKNLILISNLINTFVYNSCSNIERKFLYSSRISSFFSSLQKMLLILCCTAVPILAIKNQIRHNNTPLIISYMSSIINKHQFSSQEISTLIERTRIPVSSEVLLKFLDQDTIGYKTQNLIKQYISENLHHIVPNKKISESFYESPKETIVYDITFQRVEEMEKIQTEFFDQNIYKEYMREIFSTLFENYSHYESLKSLNELKSLMEINYSFVESIPETLNKIKLHCENIISHTNKNKTNFWSSSEYIAHFNQDVEKYIRDDNLSKEIIKLNHKILQDIGSTYNNFSIPVVGKIFTDQSKLSEDFLSFYSTIKSLNNHKIFNTTYFNKLQNNIYLFWNIEELKLLPANLNSLQECLLLVKNSNQKPFFTNIIKEYSTKFCQNIISGNCFVDNYDTTLHLKITNILDLLNLLSQHPIDQLNTSFLNQNIITNLNIIHDQMLTNIENVISHSSDSKNINNELNLIKNEITPIIKYFQRYTPNLIESIRDIIQDIETQSSVNALSLIENASPNNYLNTPDYIKNTNNFVSKHIEKKINNIINSKNQTYTANTVEQYNKMIHIFNREILPLFPFNHNAKNIVTTTKLISFFKMYDELRPKLNNDFFKEIQGQLSNLDKIRSMFTIDGEMLLINVTIDCDLDENKQISHIKHYSIVTKNGSSYNSYEEKNGKISSKINCEDSFGLQIELGENNNLKFKEQKIENNDLIFTSKNKILSLSCKRPFGIFYIIKTLQTKSLNHNNATTIKIQFEVINTKNNELVKICPILKFENIFPINQCTALKSINSTK